MAVGARRPLPGLLQHSDRESQYVSQAVQAELPRLDAQGSMSTCLECQVWRCESTAPSPQTRSQNGPAQALEAQAEAGSLRLALPSTPEKGFRRCPNPSSHGCPLRTLAFRMTSSWRIQATNESFLAFPRSTSGVSNCLIRPQTLRPCTVPGGCQPGHPRPDDARDVDHCPSSSAPPRPDWPLGFG